MHKYLSLKNGKYLIKNSSEAFSIFYKYFLDRPFVSKIQLIKNIYYAVDIMVEKILIAMFFIRFNLILNFILKVTYLKENFLVRREGKGQWATIIYLIKRKNGYKILKRHSKSTMLKREVSYLDKYYGRNDKIILPTYRVLDKKTIELEFFQYKNLGVLIKTGRLKEKTLFKIFNDLSEGLDKIYNQKKILIHGDLGLINIFWIKNRFYIIDFSDSKFYNKEYDKFLFLKGLCLDFYGEEKFDLYKNFFSTKDVKKYNMHHQKNNLLKHGKPKK